jgi:flavin-dependent dehydrogenase
LRTFVVGFGKQTPVQVEYGSIVGYGIRRCEFDDYLLRKAAVPSVLGTPLRSLRRQGGQWVLNDEIRTPLVIGAAGHFCPVAQFVGAELGRSETSITAQEIEFEDQTCAASRDSVPAPGLYFCEDLKGYGWCFRKGRYVNIGFGREESGGLAQSMRDFWSWLVEVGQAPAGMRPRFQGHAYLSRAQSTRPLFDEGVLLIGDSAGLADPVSGEGIRPAIESALLAARIVQASAGIYSRDRLSGYAELIGGHFGARGPRGASSLPACIRTTLARFLMKSAWLTRHVVLDRGFLHANVPALQADSFAANIAAGQLS